MNTRKMALQDDLLEFVTGGNTSTVAPPVPVKNSKKQKGGYSLPYSAATSAKLCWGPNGEHVFEGVPGSRICKYCRQPEDFE